jgi:hypothetical protein
MNPKTWTGLLLLAASYGQLLFPRRLFAHPTVFFHGYPVVPANLLGIAAAYSTLGVILIGEGICQRLGAPSLLDRVTRDWGTFGRFLLAAAAAGLAMEALGQWLAKLWIYPYWTVWFYCIVLLPGFAFYWTAIAESYLAVKAILDSRIRTPVEAGSTRYMWMAGLAGAGVLLASGLGYASWYAAHGGYFFANTRPVPQAPPFGYMVFAFLGSPHARGMDPAHGVAEPAAWVLDARRGHRHQLGRDGLPLGNPERCQPFLAYTHFPWPDLTLAGVQLSMVASWPLQYLTFLLLPSLLLPTLADLFWRPGS